MQGSSHNPTAPQGCQDLRLWTAAAELLSVHSGQECIACGEGAPCSVLSSAAEAQGRAMMGLLPRTCADGVRTGGHSRVIGYAKIPIGRRSRLLGWLIRGRG
jgi:hypothetical protein